MKMAIVISGLLVLFGAVACLVKQSLRKKVSDWLVSKWYGIVLLPAGLLIFNFLLVILTGSWNGEPFARLIIYFAVATMLVAIGNWQKIKASNVLNGIADLAVIFWLWLPVEFDFIETSWLIAGINYPFAKASAMIYGLIVFTAWRQKDFKLDWCFKLRDFKAIGLAFLIMSGLIIWPALKIGFAHWGLNDDFRSEWYWHLLGIWFAPALAEEVLFRGVIQSVLVKWFKPVAGIIFSALIFGASHLDNRVGDFHPPNWTYFIFAAIAGVAYGTVYYRRNLQSSTTLHWLVDFVWWTLFKGGK